MGHIRGLSKYLDLPTELIIRQQMAVTSTDRRNTLLSDEGMECYYEGMG